jgi:hypothetical protein
VGRAKPGAAGGEERRRALRREAACVGARWSEGGGREGSVDCSTTQEDTFKGGVEQTVRAPIEPVCFSTQLSRRSFARLPDPIGQKKGGNDRTVRINSRAWNSSRETSQVANNMQRHVSDSVPGSDWRVALRPGARPKSLGKPILRPRAIGGGRRDLAARRPNSLCASPASPSLQGTGRAPRSSKLAPAL